MNKEDIKKALAYCASDRIDDCRACPYADNGPFACSISMYKDALNLITEQEKEIERLRTTLRQCNTELNSALESLKSQCREIGELKAKVKQTKIDVLTELKKKTYVNDYCREVVEIEKIDELLKEYEDDTL